jgi:hypothetical protein
MVSFQFNSENGCLMFSSGPLKTPPSNPSCTHLQADHSVTTSPDADAQPSSSVNGKGNEKASTSSEAQSRAERVRLLCRTFVDRLLRRYVQSSPSTLCSVSSLLCLLSALLSFMPSFCILIHPVLVVLLIIFLIFNLLEKRSHSSNAILVNRGLHQELYWRLIWSKNLS